MTKKERADFLREVEKTGKASLYKEAQIYCNYKEILDITTNPREFKKLWEDAPNSTKLFFIKDSMKYALKEKGKETDGDGEDRDRNRTRYDEMVELTEKLS